MFCLLELGITKIPTKLTKDKVKEKKGKGAGNLLEIAPLNALVDQEGLKVSLSKGMYVTRLSALIHVI